MMRSIAIGLAAATIAMSGSALSASPLHGQSASPHRSGIASPHRSGIGPHTYGYYNEQDRLTPREREHTRRVLREGFAELTPREREHLRGAVRERLAALSPGERAHLRGILRERMADLTPSERAYVRGIIREHLASRSGPREREDLSRIERDRFYRHGPYGRQ